MMSLTLASNEFFSTNFSTFLTQKIVENLEVFVVLNVHLTNFFSLGGCLANFLYHKIKKKSPVQHIIFKKKGKIKATIYYLLKAKGANSQTT